MIAPLVYERRARFPRLYELSAVPHQSEIPAPMIPVDPMHMEAMHPHSGMPPPVARREDPRNKKRKGPIPPGKETSSSRSQPPYKRRDPRRGWYDGSDDGSDTHETPVRSGSGPESDGPTDVRGRSRPKGGRDDMEDQRYCFCNNVSYGDMIGCDDDDCEREWFHLECVGLSKPPQGTWYCDACLERRNVRLILTSHETRHGGARQSQCDSHLQKPILGVHLVLDDNLLVAVDRKELDLEHKSRVRGDDWSVWNVLGGKPRGP